MAKIEFGDLIIEQISDSSGVFAGNNIQVKWKSYGKTDSGFGSIAGDGNSSVNQQSAVIRPRLEAE
jgi:hypothetical protein